MMLDLNLDAGEDFAMLSDGREARLYALVTRVNIACGGHAGDAGSMRLALELARDAGVKIGAHPGYPDRENFGRLPLRLPAAVVTRFVAGQVAALRRLADEAGVRLEHVKPHGALYNQLAADEALARAVAEGVRQVDPKLALVGLARSRALAVWREMGFTVLAEAFADRRYRDDGTLVPRTEPGAVLDDAAQVLAQVKRLKADTYCVHGDNPGAEELLRALREIS